MFAHVTQDGHAVHMGSHPLSHPLYGTPSVEIQIRLSLSTEEVEAYREVTQNHTGTIRPHIRSALAQLGLDAFHPSFLDMHLSGHDLIIDTLVTSLNGDVGMQVIDQMRMLMQQDCLPRFMHVGILPDAARVATAAQTAELCAQGTLQLEGADIYEDGSIGLPPTPILYRFRPEVLYPQTLSDIFMGDGRATLARMREEANGLPASMHARDFLVTGVFVHTEKHHVVLRSQTFSDHIPTPIIHGESCVLQAGRTRGGSRQLELWNANGHTQDISRLRVVADLYAAATILEPGH